MLQRKDRGQDNHWVVKLAQGSRSTDVCLTDSAELVVRYREAPGGDRVVQKYIENPLLFKGRKMDLRVCAQPLVLCHHGIMCCCGCPVASLASWALPLWTF